MKPLIVVLGLGFVLGLPAQGLAQTVRAYLSQNEVPLNRQFVLNVEVSGTQQLDEDPPVLPDLSAFAAFLGSGTSTSMQIVNGRTSMSLTFQHRFQATAEGTFEIGPVTVRAGGRDLRTEPLTIRIIDGPAPTTRSGPPGADETVAPEDLFVTATASKPRVYVNEPVIVEYRSSPVSTSTATTSRSSRAPPASGSRSSPTRRRGSSRSYATGCNTQAPWSGGSPCSPPVPAPRPWSR